MIPSEKEVVNVFSGKNSQEITLTNKSYLERYGCTIAYFSKRKSEAIGSGRVKFNESGRSF